jgi:hypothetical protein
MSRRTGHASGSTWTAGAITASREIVEALSPGSARLEVIEGAGHHFPGKDAPDRYGPPLTGFMLTATA